MVKITKNTKESPPPEKTTKKMKNENPKIGTPVEGVFHHFTRLMEQMRETTDLEAHKIPS